MRLSPPAIGLICALITIATWTTFITVSRAMADRNLLPLDVILLRFSFAGLILLPWGWLICRSRPGRPAWLGLSPLSFRTSAVLGLFAGWGFALPAYHAFLLAPASHASVLMPGTLPLWSAIFAVLLIGERLSRQRLIGLALVLSGALMVGGNSLLKALDGGTVWIGDLLYMCAPFCWAIFGSLCRRWKIPAADATIAMIVFSLVTYAPLHIALVWLGVLPSGLGQAPWSEIVLQGSLQGIFSVAVAGITYVKMTEIFGPVRSSMMTAVVPGLAATSAIVFLGEPFSWNIAAGLLGVTLGIIVGVRSSAGAGARPAS